MQPAVTVREVIRPAGAATHAFLLRNRLTGAFAAREEAMTGDDAVLQMEDVAHPLPTATEKWVSVARRA